MKALTILDYGKYNCSTIIGFGVASFIEYVQLLGFVEISVLNIIMIVKLWQKKLASLEATLV